MTSKLKLIVEGAGDKAAIPMLVRRILESHSIYDVSILPSIPVSGEVNKARKNFSSWVRYAMKDACPILWVLDCDDKQVGCAVQHVQYFEQQLDAIHNGKNFPLAFAFFTYEFETLFLQEQNALQQVFEFKKEAYFPDNPLRKRGAKEWINGMLPNHVKYSEDLDQPKITQRLDLDICRERSRDFRHLESALLRLVAKK